MSSDSDEESPRNSSGMLKKISDFYYISQEGRDEEAKNIFAWLGISPKPLNKSTSYDFRNVVIFYITWGCSRAFDDIAKFYTVLHDYSLELGNNTFYILGMRIYDDANKHKHECVISSSTEDGPITFIEIHCSNNGSIHNCEGNKGTKERLQTALESSIIPVKIPTTWEQICRWTSISCCCVCCIDNTDTGSMQRILPKTSQ